MLFIIDEVRVDFVQYPFPWLLPFEMIDAIRFISAKDIIPMKLQAVSNRFSKKDYWDVAFLLNTYSLTEMLNIFREKFPQIDPGYIIHSLTNFEEAENQPDPDVLLSISWNEIKEKLSKAVKDFAKNSLK
jgi:predicted nucleotidyltransferase component of viral defense system